MYINLLREMIERYIDSRASNKLIKLKKKMISKKKVFMLIPNHTLTTKNLNN
jgi:hypothetical protein